MRRTVGLAAVVTVLMLLVGVANATPLSVSAPVPLIGGGGVAVPVVGEAGVAAGGQYQRGPGLVGVLEEAEAVLGGAGHPGTATFAYPGAEYVKVHLAAESALRPGDHLTVSDPDGEEVHRYDVDSWSDPESGMWTMSVTGDTAVVSLHTAAPERGTAAPEGSTDPRQSLVRVDRVARGFAPGEQPTPGPAEGPGSGPPAIAGGDGREESVCGGDDSRDAACYSSSHPRVYHNAQAVVRLLIEGVQLCTAFRVGEKNRLLTNNHCLSDTRQARNTEVWFGYQCVECGSRLVHRPAKVWGKQVLATHGVLDFTLFSVDRFRAVAGFGHLELATRAPKSGQKIYIPQHPGGAPARVAIGSDRDSSRQCVITDPQAHGYGWYTDASYYCDTEAGSSGSPVLARGSHRVVALHHFGGCPNAGVRMDLIRPHIARYL